MDTIIQAKIPEQLLLQARGLVNEGWVSDLDSLIAEALRRFIESHRSEISEEFIRDDVRWGIDGTD